MKINETESWWWAVSTSISASAAGAASQIADDIIALAMMAIGGICAVVSALYYRANDAESAARDAVVSIGMAFLIGAAAGEIIGALIDGAIAEHTSLHLSIISQHMIGGGIAGGALTPLMRAIMSGKIGALLEAAQAAIDKMKGSGK